MAEARAKVAFVTGATSGIGQAVATGLAKAGMKVFIMARDETRAKATVSRIKSEVPTANVDVVLGDLASQNSVRQAAQAFLKKSDRLDVLVNSAGVFLKARSVTEYRVERTFATNHLGHFLLDQLLVPALKKAAPSRVVIVASRYGGAKIDFDDLMVEKRKWSYLKAVPASKLAQVLFAQEFAERLRGTGVTVNSLHPGLVANTKLLSDTKGFFRWMTNRLGGTPEKGADTALWLATAPEVASETGKMWAKRKPLKTPGQGSDPAARKRLWDESEKLLKPGGKQKLVLA